MFVYRHFDKLIKVDTTEGRRGRSHADQIEADRFPRCGCGVVMSRKAEKAVPGMR